MNKVILLATVLLSACTFYTETTTYDGFMIAYGKLQIEILAPERINDEILISFEDKTGEKLFDLGDVSRADGKILVSINTNWGREYGNTQECLFYSGEKYCRRQSGNTKFEEFLVLSAPNLFKQKYMLSDLKDCMLAGLVCKNLVGGGRLVTLDIAVVQH